jgi:plastocyanin
MRLRLPLLLLVLFTFTTSVFAKDVFLSIAGTVGNFHTDARIFNPTSKEITVQAYFLPVGLVNNSAVQSVSITIPKRSMKVLDDVVTGVFSASGIGAIRLSCADDFVATSRIYAQTATGTLGQFVQGLEGSSGMKNGVLIQMKSNSAFRTNIGAANPNNVTANVMWYLYDKNNALIGTGKAETMPPYGVLGPTNVVGYFNTTADLSDAWVAYVSDQPIFSYVSVLDSVTTDPTYIPALLDTGAIPPSPPNPGGSVTRTFTVTEKNSQIDFSPLPTDLEVGDVVQLNITARDATHGFQLVGPGNQVLIESMLVPPNQPAIIKKFTVSKTGTYVYFCTNTTCSTGHGNMTGLFDVGDPTDHWPGY